MSDPHCLGVNMRSTVITSPGNAGRGPALCGPTVQTDVQRLLALCLLVALAAAHFAIAEGVRPAPLVGAAGACGPDRARFVTACYRGLAGERNPTDAFDREAPSIVAFSLPSDGYEETVLATYEQVGTVWGLAYSAAEDAVYAAAFHKRQLPFGPCGTGGIYRIDLGSGAVSCLVKVPGVARNQHRFGSGHDRPAERGTSRTSLGDLEISDDGSELYAVNLDDRYIYRFAVPSGDLLGRFEHGAAHGEWASEARPFGLAYRDGYVYHGLVHSAELKRRADDLAAYIYRSLPDGAEMTLVGSFQLDFPRGGLEAGFGWEGKPLDWAPWRDNYRVAHDWTIPVAVVNPMPLVSDIGFDADGNMLVALRDRWSDSAPFFVTYNPAVRSSDILGAGFGDIVRGVRLGDAWQFDTAGEHYDDDGPGLGDEIVHGGLAGWPHTAGAIVGAYATDDPAGILLHGWFYAGVVSYDDSTGAKREQRTVCHSPISGRIGTATSALGVGHAPLNEQLIALPVATRQVCHIRGPPTMGDVEALCQATLVLSPTSTPALTATATPTPTSEPSLTVAATATKPAPSGRWAYLPLVLRLPRCVPGTTHADVALVIDASTSMADPAGGGESKLEAARRAARVLLGGLDLAGGDQATVVAFNDRAQVVQQLTSNEVALSDALESIEVAQYTRIHLGIDEAHLELAGTRHRPENDRAMVILTDGVNNPEPVAEALERAARAKADGIRIFTVGLGEEIDAQALRDIASRPQDYYFAPSAQDLARIFDDIGRTIPCPPEESWPRTGSADGWESELSLFA